MLYINSKWGVVWKCILDGYLDSTLYILCVLNVY